MKKIAFRFPGLKVLLVEDYFMNREVTKDLFELFACAVDEVETGEMALQFVPKGHYDLIIMDVQLPGMDGLATTQAILALPDLQPKPKIIALTASALDGDREKCLAAGMDDYISKPVEASQLEAMMKKYFLDKAVAR